MQNRANILIVDDEAGPRESLKMILKPFYGVYTAESGEKALQIVKDEEIDLVTLDLKMPDFHGTEVLRKIKDSSGDTEVVIITGFGSLKSAVEGIRYGASDYLLKPFNVSEIVSVINRALEKKRLYKQLKILLKNLGNLLGLEMDLNEVRKTLNEKYTFLEKFKDVLEKDIEGNTEEGLYGNIEFSKTLADMYESRNVFSKGHSSRVHHYANLLANKLDLTQEQKHTLQIAAYIHDIGKIGLDQSTFLKEDDFMKDENETSKKHPIVGVDLVAPIGIPDEVLEVIRHHHEHFNGAGYPDGLKKDKIPLLARVLSVVDAFDAMVTDRPERKAMSLENIILELERCAGNQFDPTVVNSFLEVISEEKDRLLPSFLNVMKN